MRNLGLLLKVYFKAFIGNFIKKAKQPKFIIAVVVSLGFSITLAIVFGLNAYFVIDQYKEIVIEQPDIDFRGMIMYVNCLMAIMLFFLLVVTRAVFAKRSRDFEMLYAMPIRKSEIVTAKFIYNYLFDCFGFLLIFMPSIIVYAYMIQGATVLVVVRGLIISLLLPLLSNSIAIALGFLFERISRLFRFYSLIQTICCVALLVVYFIYSFRLNNYLEGHATNEAIYQNFFISWMLKFLLTGHVMSFGYLFLVCLLPAFLAILIMVKSLSSSGSIRQLSKKALTYRMRKPVYSLFIKEIKSYFACPVYVVNTIFGAIIYIIMAFMFNKQVEEYLATYLSLYMNIASLDMTIVFILVLIVTISSVITTSASISLEGKRLWLLKVLPFNVGDIFKAKILTNIAITFIPIVIGSICVIVNTSIFVGIMVFVLSLLVSLLASMIGLFINLMLPKMEWHNEEEVVKRSMAPILSLLVSLMIAPLPIGLFYAISMYYHVPFHFILPISVTIYGILIIIMRLILLKRGARLFNQIN